VRNVASNEGCERAERPEDLGRLFVQRANAGDLEGLVALYEPDAVLAFPRGKLTTGRDAIRREYEQFLAGKPTLDGESQRGLCFGDLALPPRGSPAAAPPRWPDDSRTAPGSG
jgi:hypothetical protein